MAVEYISVSLGSNEDGAQRRTAYEKAARIEDMNVSEWMRKHLDKASNFKPKGE